MKRILSILLIALLVCGCFVGCSGSGSSGGSGGSGDGFVGTYYPKTINGKGVRDFYMEQAQQYGLDLATFLSYSGLTEATLDKFEVLEFRQDGTGKLTTPQESMDFTWTLDGEKLTLKVDGATETYTYKNGQVTIESMGVTVVFGK